MSVQTMSVKAKAKEYKEDIRTLEQRVKEWKETRVKEVSKAADDCYDAFNDFQMELTRIKKDKATYDKYQLLCYRETFDLLEFIENKVNIDFCVLLLNNSPSFTRLVTHYNAYCSKIEQEYNIELDSEKGWLSDDKIIKNLKPRRKNG